MIAALCTGLVALASLTAPVPATSGAGQAELRGHTKTQPKEPTPRQWRLDHGMVVGIGERTGFGTELSLVHDWRIWKSRRTTGHFDTGPLLGYQFVPYALRNGRLGQAMVTGGDHRIETLWQVGLRLQSLGRSKLGFATHIYGGWVGLLSRGGLTNNLRGVAGQVDTQLHVFSSGTIFSVFWAPWHRVAFSLRVRSPFLFSPAVATNYVSLSLGLNIRLR